MNRCRALPSSLLLLVASTLPACAQQTAAAGPQEPATLLELAPSSPAQVAAAEPAPVAPAARARPEDRLIGVWEIDVEATMAADEKVKAMPEDQRAMAKEFASKLFKESKFEFTSDGRMIATFGGKKEEGSFTVLRAERDTLVLSTKSNGKDEELKAELQGSKLIITTEKEMQFFMQRKQGSGSP